MQFKVLEKMTAAEFSIWMIPQLKPLREAILRYYKPDSCVASTAILLKHIQRHLGSRVQVEAISVDVVLTNAPYMQQFAQHPENLPSERVVQQWQRKHGAYKIGLGAWSDGESLTGHLVALVWLADIPMMVDMSLDQGRRTEWGIVPDPICILVPGYFIEGTKQISDSITNPPNSLYPHYFVGYGRALFEGWHLDHPDWTDKKGLHKKVLERYYG